MAKKTTISRPEEKQPEWTKHVCDDCLNRVWVDTHSNLDWYGKPICLTCRFEKYYIIRGRKACQNWKKREETNND